MSQRARSVGGIGEHIGAQFTTQTWVLIPICAAFGTVAGVFTQTLRLPIYLDAIGVIVLALLAGPWPALLAGLFTNVLEGIFVSPTWFAYAPVNMAFGLVAGYLFLHGGARSYLRLFLVGLAIAVTSIVVSGLITTFVFGGISGSGSSAVVAGFLAAGNSILLSVIKTASIVEPIDKELTVFLAYFVVRAVPARYRPEISQRILPE